MEKWAMRRRDRATPVWQRPRTVNTHGRETSTVAGSDICLRRRRRCCVVACPPPPPRAFHIDALHSTAPDSPLHPSGSHSSPHSLAVVSGRPPPPDRVHTTVLLTRRVHYSHYHRAHIIVVIFKLFFYFFFFSLHFPPRYFIFTSPGALYITSCTRGRGCKQQFLGVRLCKPYRWKISIIIARARLIAFEYPRSVLYYVYGRGEETRKKKKKTIF